jgi:hypothetical protein
VLDDATHAAANAWQQAGLPALTADDLYELNDRLNEVFAVLVDVKEERT